MKKTDFSTYTLALFKSKELIYSTERSGLRPILEAISMYIDKEKDLVLHDKVTGLASAKAIAYSGIIKEIYSLACSRDAKEHLEKTSIRVEAEEIVDNILTKDRSDTCPMEKKALREKKDDEEFTKELFDIFKIELQLRKR